MFKKHPLVPFGFFIHSRHFHKDHKYFIETIHQAVPSLSLKITVIVTDREFTFSDFSHQGIMYFAGIILKEICNFI